MEEFIKKFISATEEDISFLLPETEFRKLDFWDSMTGLCIMSMVDSEYNVNLSADDMRTVNTVKELYDLVKNKMPSDG